MTAPHPLFEQRAAGVLLHITSLPGDQGVGDLGPAARHFVDWLAAGKQSLWQTLPIGPVGHGNSPYSATSSFAGEPLLISLDDLVTDGLPATALSIDPFEPDAMKRKPRKRDEKIQNRPQVLRRLQPGL